MDLPAKAKEWKVEGRTTLSILAPDSPELVEIFFSFLDIVIYYSLLYGLFIKKKKILKKKRKKKRKKRECVGILVEYIRYMQFVFFTHLEYIWFTIVIIMVYLM